MNTTTTNKISYILKVRNEQKYLTHVIDFSSMNVKYKAVDNVQLAICFTNSESAKDYLKNVTGLNEKFEVAKYNPNADDDSEEETDSDNNESDDFFRINEAKNDDAYDFWKETRD